MYEVGHGKPPASYNYKPGQPPSNPGGFPQSRRKLTKRFCDAFHKDFDEHGDAAIVRLREDHVDKYCQMIIDMMPAEMKVNVAPTAELERLSGDISWIRDAIESARAKTAAQVMVPERPVLPAPVRVQED